MISNDMLRIIQLIFCRKILEGLFTLIPIKDYLQGLLWYNEHWFTSTYHNYIPEFQLLHQQYWDIIDAVVPTLLNNFLQRLTNTQLVVEIKSGATCAGFREISPR